MQLYIFLSFLILLLSQAAQQIQASVPDKNYVATINTLDNQNVENIYLKNASTGINGSFLLSEISTSTEQANNCAMVLSKAPQK